MISFFNGQASNVASGTAGALSGAFIMNLINKFSMRKKDIKIEDLQKRLGGDISDEELERALNKVLILQTLAYQDSILSDQEKLIIIHYILENKYIPADLKVELIKKLDDPVETNFFDYVESVKIKVKHKKTFYSEEEKFGFVMVMQKLTIREGETNHKQQRYFELVCKACDLPMMIK